MKRSYLMSTQGNFELNPHALNCTRWVDKVTFYQLWKSGLTKKKLTLKNPLHSASLHHESLYCSLLPGLNHDVRESKQAPLHRTGLCMVTWQPLLTKLGRVLPTSLQFSGKCICTRVDLSMWSGNGRPHCLSRSLRTAPPLASADTGTGVKVGRASEMGFISRWPPGLPEPDRRGTAAERGARKGLDSPGRRAGTAETEGVGPVRHQDIPGWLVLF